jgi:hypothetical protein
LIKTVADLPRGDLDRVVRQRVVMASLAHQVISGKTMSNPAALDRLQQAAATPAGDSAAPPPSPTLTAGSADPECVN